MKTCLVSDNLIGYHQTWSGAEIVCNYLASLLKKEGQEVIFLTLRSGRKKTPANILPLPALVGRVWFFKKIIPIHIFFRTVFAFYHLKKIKPDIIHLLHTNSLFIPVMVSAKILKIPTTFTVLDYFIICPQSDFRLNNGKICCQREDWRCLKCVSIFRVLERRIIRRLAKHLDRIITFTETSKSRLVKHGFSPDKIKVKYIYSFPLKIFGGNKERINETDNTILFVGSFHQHKGLGILIKALPDVLARVPNSKLVVVGTGNKADKTRIKKLVNKLKIDNYIEFLGHRKNEETLRLILKSALIVVPEQWLSDFGPIILLEAMALGKPVVASRIGAIPEFIKDGFNGFLADYNQPKEFAKKITLLLEDKVFAKTIGKRAKKPVQFLLESNQSEEIINLYKTLNT